MFVVAIITLASIGALLYAYRRTPRGRARRLSMRDNLVGSYGILCNDLIPGVIGKVEVHGTHWNAEAFESLAKGSRVIVVAQDNLTLTVSSTYTTSQE